MKWPMWYYQNDNIGAVEKENKPANSNKASTTPASTKAQPPNSGKPTKSGATNQNGQPSNRNDRGPREG